MVTDRRCRCGSSMKTMLCSGEFLCDKKCNRKRNCGVHQCRKRCCDGNCPQCEELFGKPLQCKNHICDSPCHTGPCYTCNLMIEITCHCGDSKTSVLCGREKVTEAPNCKELCKEPPYCRQQSQTDYLLCHCGECLDCEWKC